METSRLKLKSAKEGHVQSSDYTLADYYAIEDSVNSLERLRTYQLNDIMSRMGISKYKLF